MKILRALTVLMFYPYYAMRNGKKQTKRIKVVENAVLKTAA